MIPELQSCIGDEICLAYMSLMTKLMFSRCWIVLHSFARLGEKQEVCRIIGWLFICVLDR